MSRLSKLMPVFSHIQWQNSAELDLRVAEMSGIVEYTSPHIVLFGLVESKFAEGSCEAYHTNFWGE